MKQWGKGARGMGEDQNKGKKKDTRAMEIKRLWRASGRKVQINSPGSSWESDKS